MLGEGGEEDEGDGTANDDAASNRMDVDDTSATTAEMSQRARKTPVATPSSSEVLPRPSGSSATSGKSITSPPEPVPEETRGATASSKGKGKGRAAEAGVGAAGKPATSSSSTTGATDRGERGNGSARATAAAAAEGMTGDNDDDGVVGDEASRLRKRPRIDAAKSNIAAPAAATAAHQGGSGADIDATAMDTRNGQAVAVRSTQVPAVGREEEGVAAAGDGVGATKTALVAAPVPASGGGGGHGGQAGHEDDDDDGFEFPALVVDADPDE